MDESIALVPGQETLTPAQDALVDEIAERAIREVLGHGEIDVAAVNPFLSYVYETLFETKMPKRVEVVASPHAAFALEKELTGETLNELDWLGASDAGWVTFY